MKKHRKRYVGGLVFSSFELAIIFVIPIVNEMLVAMVTDIGDDNTLQLVSLILAGCLMLIPFVATGQYYLNTANILGTIEIRKAIFDRILNIPIAIMPDRKMGDYITSLTTDVNRASNVFNFSMIIRVAQFIILVSVSTVLLMLTDWRLSVVGFFFGITNMILAMILNPRVQELDRHARVDVALSSSFLIEVLQGMSIIRVFLLKYIVMENFGKIIDRIRLKRESFQTMSGFSYGIIDFFLFTAQTTGFAIAIHFVSQGSLTIANSVFAATLIGVLTNGIHKFSEFLLLIQPSIVSVRRIYDILDSSQEDERETDLTPDTSGEIAVRLSGVSFSYAGKLNKVLDNINLEIKTGEKLAIIGDSGSGKTTLMIIIMGLYEPSEGTIEYFGVDSSNISLRDIRQLSAYVAQESFVFDNTIRYNIALGKQDATDEEIIAATKKANIHDHILALPNSYDTLTGEMGVLLSGGERQRICIARALLKNAPILLLDEATASLDSDTEEKILEELNLISQESTIISIAHRQSSIINADRVIKLENGQVV